MNVRGVFDEHDLFDDATETTPMIGLKTPFKLRDRFLGRLSTMTTASTDLDRSSNQNAVVIRLERKPGTDQCRIQLDEDLKLFLQSLEKSLAVIAMHPDRPKFEEARESLWDSMLAFSYLNMDHVVASMNRSFSDNNEAFGDFVATWIGIDAIDEKGSKVDSELGSLLISLHQAVVSYDQSMGQLHTLIIFAWNVVNVIHHLHNRLRYLLQKTRFANELYRLICTLGSPKRAHDTFVRAAQINQGFRQLRFRLIPTVPSPRRLRFAETPQISSRSAGSPSKPAKKLANPDTPTTATSEPNIEPLAPKKPNSHMQFHGTAVNASRISTSTPQSQPHTSQEKVTPTNQPDMVRSTIELNKHDDLAVVRPYLAAEDQALSLAQLRPASKQEAAQLCFAVLRGQLIAMDSNAWYSFGFVTMHNQEDERQLAGLYAAILREARTPTAIFRELLHALETHTLVQLFDIKEWGHFRQLFPQLRSFLDTPIEKRSSVWRLIHYIRIDSYIDPVPVLKRDYGYQFCRNHQEVSVVNNIYERILLKSSPKELHNACLHGRIAEFAMQKGVHVDPKERRFLQNDYGYHGLGFDNEESLGRHRAPLFKKALKSRKI